MTDNKSNIRLSKKLSWCLRHGASEVGLQINESGWVMVQDILALSQFRRITIDELKNVVESCPKKRFSLKEEENGLYIRANQGHSLQTVSSVYMKQILSAADIPVSSPNADPCVVHGTNISRWKDIKQQGLNRMKRNHIHFAVGVPQDSGILSGMRSNCSLYIYIDIEKALADGFTFYLSENNVVLCPGNEIGCLPPKYFKEVYDIKNKKTIVDSN